MRFGGEKERRDIISNGRCLETRERPPPPPASPDAVLGSSYDDSTHTIKRGGEAQKVPVLI
jgi:hypothetical protein